MNPTAVTNCRDTRLCMDFFFPPFSLLHLCVFHPIIHIDYPQSSQFSTTLDDMGFTSAIFPPLWAACVQYTVTCYSNCMWWRFQDCQSSDRNISMFIFSVLMATSEAGMNSGTRNGGISEDRWATYLLISSTNDVDFPGVCMLVPMSDTGV